MLRERERGLFTIKQREWNASTQRGTTLNDSFFTTKYYDYMSLNYVYWDMIPRPFSVISQLWILTKNFD